MKQISKSIIVIILTIFSLGLSVKVFAQSYVLGMIEVRFCNDNKTNNEVDLTSKAGKKLSLCVEFVNKATAPVTINVEFLDSLITADAFKNRACNAADRPKTQFGNFILPYSGETILPPQKTTQKEYSMIYPIGFSGLSHGCLAYNVIGTDISNENMFTIRIRSIKYIDIFVYDTQPVQALSFYQRPTLKKVGDEYSISLGVSNRGNVDEKIHITGTLSNMLGYQKDFVFDTIIPSNSGMLLTTKSFILPAYGGLFWVHSEITYTPEFNFNITNGKKPNQVYIPGTKNIRNILFVRTRISRVVIVIILWIVYRIMRKRIKHPREEKENKTPL